MVTAKTYQYDSNLDLKNLKEKSNYQKARLAYFYPVFQTVQPKRFRNFFAKIELKESEL